MTLTFQLDTEEKKKAGLPIIAAWQAAIKGATDEIKSIEKQMRDKCPDLASKLLSVEEKKKKLTKNLKETIAGIDREPYTVKANVIVQPAEEPGYIEFIENSGTGIVLMKEPGLANQIEMDIENEDENEEF